MKGSGIENGTIGSHNIKFRLPENHRDSVQQKLSFTETMKVDRDYKREKAPQADVISEQPRSSHPEPIKENKAKTEPDEPSWKEMDVKPATLWYCWIDFKFHFKSIVEITGFPSKKDCIWQQH